MIASRIGTAFWRYPEYETPPTIGVTTRLRRVTNRTVGSVNPRRERAWNAGSIGVSAADTPMRRYAGALSGGGRPQAFCGKPSSMPPWLGSSQRLVIAFPRVKNATPSAPWAWLSPNSDAFQPPKL
jgi:hypothetical protein